jgi:hypothetical protein
VLAASGVGDNGGDGNGNDLASSCVARGLTLGFLLGSKGPKGAMCTSGCSKRVVRNSEQYAGVP